VRLNEPPVVANGQKLHFTLRFVDAAGTVALLYAPHVLASTQLPDGVDVFNGLWGDRSPGNSSRGIEAQPDLDRLGAHWSPQASSQTQESLAELAAS